MPIGPTRARSLVWSTAGVIAATVVVALMSSGHPAGELAHVVGLLVLSVAAWVFARRSPRPVTASLIAVVLTLTLLGDATWYVHRLALGREPGLSPADVPWVLSYLVLALALLRLTPGSYRRRTDPDGLVDLAVVFMVVMLLQWEVALDGILNDDSATVAQRFVWFLYPTFGAGVLALLVRAVLARRLRGGAASFLGAAIVLWLVADTLWSVVGASGEAQPLLDVAWLLGAVCFVAAIPQIGPIAAVDPDRPAMTSSHLVPVMVALVPLVVPGSIGISQDLRGGRTSPFVIHGVTLILLALAFARVVRLLHAERDAREAVGVQERYAHTIAMHSSDAVALLGTDGVVMRNSPKLADLLGYPGVDPRGSDAFAWIVSEDRGDAWAVFERCLAEPETVHTTEFRMSDAVGAIRWFGARLVDKSLDPDVGGVIVTLHDITERKEIEHTVAHLAFHDGLTGLPNRDLFNDRCEHSLHLVSRSAQGVAVLFLDLDGFKKVNDGFGHEVGDELLREVADRLSAAVRESDTVARMGGDEFAVLIEHNTDPIGQAQMVADRIIDTLSTPFALSVGEVSIGASVGIAVGTRTASVSSLLQDADVAMYRAKTDGKNRWVVHDPGMRAVVVERLQIEQDLPTAIRNGQLELEYLPVVDLRTERIVGFESLVRWRHPMLGMITPDRFLRAAEETGQIVELGRWVLREACRAAARWHHHHGDDPDLVVGVNVSGRQLVSTDLVDDVVDVLAATGLAAEHLVLEISEAALVHDPDVAARRLHELWSFGVGLALDDFGTGNSSLSHLRQFPMRSLKIDRSFIDMIGESDDVPAILRGLIDLGRTLGLQTIAEGVEHVHQLELLRTNGCDLGQGYLFSKPLSAIDVDLLLLRTLPTPASP